MKRSFLALGWWPALLVASLPLAATAQEGGKTFYWVSHGDPADPVWTYFLDGANQWAADTGNTVNTSFHSGDVPTHQEAIRAAIAAGADGIVTSSPDPGSLVEVAAEANAAGIPIININTPDPTASFDAYVGTNNVEVGRALGPVPRRRRLRRRKATSCGCRSRSRAPPTASRRKRASPASSSPSASPGRSRTRPSTRPRSSRACPTTCWPTATRSAP